METSDDPYVLLEIPRDSTEDTIKGAYRKLARKYHPDKGGDAKQFLKINEAHQLLTTPELRKVYDQHGMQGVEAFKKTGGVPMGGFGFPGGGSGGGDFFSQFFGGAGHPGHPSQQQPPQGPKRIPDRLVEIEVTPEEAYQGKTIKYRLQRKICKPGVQLPMCETCKGRGRVAVRPPGIPAFVMIPMQVSLCSACAGLGLAVTDTNMETVAEVISIDLPMHCPDHFRHVVRGKTDEIPTFETGDVMFQINLGKSSTPGMTLVNGNVVTEIKMNLQHALGGGFQQSIRYLDGLEYHIQLAPGKSFFTKPLDPSKGFKDDGYRVIKDRGFYMDPSLEHRQRGDWILKFIIEMPTGNTDAWCRDLVQKSSFTFHTDRGGNVLDVLSLPSLSRGREDGDPDSDPQYHQGRQGHPNVQECRPS